MKRRKGHEIDYAGKKYVSLHELCDDLDLPYSPLAHKYYRTKDIEQSVERAEQRVTELESEVVALEKQMAAGVVNDELLKKYGETQKELEEAMTEWEKATEEEEEVKSKR